MPHYFSTTHKKAAHKKFSRFLTEENKVIFLWNHHGGYWFGSSKTAKQTRWSPVQENSFYYCRNWESSDFIQVILCQKHSLLLHQYDNRLFSELLTSPVRTKRLQVYHMLCKHMKLFFVLFCLNIQNNLMHTTCFTDLVVFLYWSHDSTNNLLSYLGLNGIIMIASLNQTAKRSRAGVWVWCSLPLVPHLNPFAAIYVKESLSLRTKNNRVLWVVEFSANPTKTQHTE